MKTPEDNSEPLRQTLREWAVDAPLPRQFQAQVWQRIARGEARPVAAPWTALRHWIEERLAQPALAAAYVAVLLGVGLTAGYWQARAETSRSEDASRWRYLQAVDPYQAHDAFEP